MCILVFAMKGSKWPSYKGGNSLTVSVDGCDICMWYSRNSPFCGLQSPSPCVDTQIAPAVCTAPSCYLQGPTQRCAPPQVLKDLDKITALFCFTAYPAVRCPFCRHDRHIGTLNKGTFHATETATS